MTEPNRQAFCRRTLQVTEDVEDVSRIELKTRGQFRGLGAERELTLRPGALGGAELRQLLLEALRRGHASS